MFGLMSRLFHAVPEPLLSVRVKECLTRQVAWYESILGDLVNVHPDLSDDEMEKLIERPAACVGEISRFRAEVQQLAEEWRQATGISDVARDEIASLARRAEMCAVEVVAAYEKAFEIVTERSALLSGRLSGLRKGRDLLRTYRPEGTFSPDFIDKKA